MSKKRVKSGAASAGLAKWDTGLQSVTLSDSTWRPQIYFIHENQVEDLKYIQTLAHGISQGTRRLFTIFSKEELYSDVRELGNPKTKKVKEIPANYEICESCKPYLDTDDDIPIHLLVKLLKWKFLWIKSNDLKRREAEKKVTSEKEKGGGKKDRKDGKKSAGGKGKGAKKTPEPPSPKKESKLRKRGDEDLDSKYIDDEPDDGPNQYILIYGFQLPYIYQLLDEQGIPVEGMIRIRSQEYPKREIQNMDEFKKDQEEIPSERVDDVAETLLLEQKTKLRKFWHDFQIVIEQVPSSSNVHDLARMDYVVKNMILPKDPFDADKKLEFCATLYEDIARMCYDLIDTKRQYKNYLDNMKLIPIPLVVEQCSPVSVDTSAELQTSAQNTDMRYYNDIMNTIPQESVSVELVMYCMLEQISATESEKSPPSEIQKPSGQDGVDVKIAAYLECLVSSLALREDEVQLLHPDISMNEKTEEVSIQPKLISPHDGIAVRVEHLKQHRGLNASRAENEMLRYIPFAGMNSFARPSSRLAQERSARLQELIHFCSVTELAQSEIDKALKQFVFECIDITTADANGYILSTESEGAHHSIIPWDDPYPLFKGMLPKEDSASGISGLKQGSTFPSSVSVLESRNGDMTPTPDDSRLLKLDTGPQTPAERAPTPGILRSTSHLSHTTSVHFGTDHHGVEIIPLQTSPEPTKSIDESMEEIVNAQKRNLDQWCFAEHYESDVLLQVLRKALCTLPYYDTYYHKRDHSLMIVLHNPQSPDMQNCTFWENNLHSGVGFRNYIEQVSESIDGWVQTEEAKYQASLLREEVDKIEQEAKFSFRDLSADKKRGRSKSLSKKVSSRSASQDRMNTPTCDNFVRVDSLKAQSVEMERIRTEEVEKERLKAEKHAKSTQKKSSKEAAVSAEKDKKNPGSKNSRTNSRKSSSAVPPRDSETEAEEPEKEPGRYWPFVGYDLGYNMIHASGVHSCLFPSDGGLIRTERIDFILNSSIVKSTILKDDHTFCLHVLEPQNDEQKEKENRKRPELVKDESLENDNREGEEEKAEIEQNEREKREPCGVAETGALQEVLEQKHKPSISKFGSFTATLRDGLVIAYSGFGDSGEPKRDDEHVEPLPTPACVNHSPTPGKETPGKHKRDKSTDKSPTTPEPHIEDEIPQDRPLYRRPFQNLYITSPDGLQVQMLAESDCGGPTGSDVLVVRQCYPQKTANLQDCEALRKMSADEASRIITKEGNVIKCMTDGNTEVLFPDGTVSSMTASPVQLPVDKHPVSSNRVGSASKKTRYESPSKKSAKHKGSTMENEPELEEKKLNGLWQTTLPTGKKISTHIDGFTPVPTKDALVCSAHDPETKESMYTREDRVVMVHRPDGETVVEHSDGTRITRFMHETEVQVTEGISGESEKPFVVERIVRIECPGFACVEFNEQSGHCSVRIGSSIIIHAYPEASYIIDLWDGGRLNIDSEGTAAYFPRPNSDLIYNESNQELTYLMRHDSEILVETLDNEGNLFTVKANGNFGVHSKTEADNSSASEDDLNCKNSERKIQLYKQHAPRFFLIHADGSGTELLRYQDISEYLSAAESDPSTAVLIDNLVDFPNVTGINILRPAEIGLSQRWLKDYNDSTVLPSGLHTRDLRSIPAEETVKEGVKFATNLGQGLAIGSAEIQPPLIEKPRCPRVMEHRQLVQFKPVTDEIRETMYHCLREYATYVKTTNEESREMQVQYPRSGDEILHASDLVLQCMPAHADDLGAAVSEFYENATAPLRSTSPPTPQPKRTAADWERDRRELQEQVDNCSAIRNADIPPYFHSEMGRNFFLCQAPGMEALMRELAHDPRQGKSSTPTIELANYVYCTPSKHRPGNPTPSHATGTGSPASLRPAAPTPGHAANMAERPDNPTPKQSIEGNKETPKNTSSTSYHDRPERILEEEITSSRSPHKSLYEDVVSKKFGKSVWVPAYLKAGRSDMRRKHKFLTTEGKSRCKVLTSLLDGATERRAVILENARGFELLPAYVDFGNLRDGYTYRFPVQLKNTGVDSCRFKLDQPPPATSMNVMYKPGPVAAGMKTTLMIEIYAIASGVGGESGVRMLEHNLKIVTETHHVSLPIRASVLTADDYDNRSPSKILKTRPGVELVSSKSPSTHGIVRVRKYVENNAPNEQKVV